MASVFPPRLLVSYQPPLPRPPSIPTHYRPYFPPLSLFLLFSSPSPDTNFGLTLLYRPPIPLAPSLLSLWGLTWASSIICVFLSARRGGQLYLPPPYSLAHPSSSASYFFVLPPAVVGGGCQRGPSRFRFPWSGPLSTTLSRCSPGRFVKHICIEWCQIRSFGFLVCNLVFRDPWVFALKSSLTPRVVPPPLSRSLRCFSVDLSCRTAQV